MAIDFPASPGMGQQYTVGGVTWTWDGTKWVASGTGTGVYLPLTGGTMTGPLTLAANPAAPLQPATKQYVDVLPAAMNDNRLVNGDMRINQRGVGAGGGAAIGYTFDRWQFGASLTTKGTWGDVTFFGSSGPPGFPYFWGFVSTSAYASLAADYFRIAQIIEADMVSDFAFGTAGAQPVTLSFWAKSGTTGTFSGAINNAAATRSYPFTFSLPSAGVWTKIAITIPGDTAGTWVMSGNAAALMVEFDLGSGSTYRGPANAWAATNYTGATGAVSIVATNGASFFVTGVKLEIGSVATAYNRQSLAKSLADCQRYYQVYPSVIASGYNIAGGQIQNQFNFQNAMRAAPTISSTGFTFSNASALVTNIIDTQTARNNITVTVAGLGYGFGPLMLNAEL